MEQIEIILRSTDPAGKVTEQLLAKFDTEKPATEHDKVLQYSGLCIRFLYKGIIIKHNKTEPTYTKTSLFLCEKRRFFMGRTEKGGKVF